MLSNIKIENTRTEKMKHFMVRPFVPLRQRVYQEYGRAIDFLWSMAVPTSIPKKLWSIRRVRVRRAGQLELIKV